MSTESTELAERDEQEPVGEVAKDPHKRWISVDRQGYDAEIKKGDKLYRHPPSPAAVPEGWKLVPVEPTEGMMVAALREANPLGEFVDWDIRDDGADRSTVALLYREMLTAAPPAGRSEADIQEFVESQERLPGDMERVLQESRTDLYAGAEVQSSRSEDVVKAEGLEAQGRKMETLARRREDEGDDEHAQGLWHAARIVYREAARLRGDGKES